MNLVLFDNPEYVVSNMLLLMYGLVERIIEVRTLNEHFPQSFEERTDTVLITFLAIRLQSQMLGCDNLKIHQEL